MSGKYDCSTKVAIVTGASSGIGAAIARQFAQYGCRLTLSGRNEAKLAELAKVVFKLSGKEPLVVVGDLMAEGMACKLVDSTIAKFEQLNVLVNCANDYRQPTDIESEQLLTDFDYIMKLSARIPLELIQLSVKHLEKTKGNVVNISGIGSLQPFHIAYSASKAALDMITKTCAQELLGKGIRVNSVNPGFVRTPLLAQFMGGEIHEEAFTPARLASPDEIANLVSFLASDDAANVNGSIMVCDGGAMIAKRN